ncbi:MAG: outer membrane protein [Bacteroidetes bacterium HLUCCA01]|nr:MAG: outer membrane protein [Bacteroidetes bacterium HLUCCA01]
MSPISIFRQAAAGTDFNPIPGRMTPISIFRRAAALNPPPAPKSRSFPALHTAVRTILLAVLLLAAATAVQAQNRELGSLKGFSSAFTIGVGSFSAKGSDDQPQQFLVSTRTKNEMQFGHTQIGALIMYGIRDDLGFYVNGSWGFFDEDLNSYGSTFNRDLGVQYQYFGLEDMGLSYFIFPYVRAGLSSMTMNGAYFRLVDGTARRGTFEGNGFHLALGADVAFNEYASVGVDYMIKRVNLEPERYPAQTFPNTPFNHALMLHVKVNVSKYLDY